MPPELDDHAYLPRHAGYRCSDPQSRLRAYSGETCLNVQDRTNEDGIRSACVDPAPQFRFIVSEFVCLISHCIWIFNEIDTAVTATRSHGQTTRRWPSS